MIIKDIHVDESITLKVMAINDAQLIFDAIDNNRSHLRRWLPFVDKTKEVKDTLAFVKSIVDDVERRQEVFTIWYKNSFVGLIGLKEIDYLNRKVEIGYWLVAKATGKGVVTKSVEVLLNFCFHELGMNRIQIKCGAGNVKSSAIPKRIGFSFEGIERAGEKHPLGFIDLEVFSLLRKEWDEF